MVEGRTGPLQVSGDSSGGIGVEGRRTGTFSYDEEEDPAGEVRGAGVSGSGRDDEEL